MVGEYGIDEDRVRFYYKQGLIRASIIVGMISLFFFVAMLDRDDIGIVFPIVTAILIFVVGVGKYIGSTSDHIFENTLITIEEDRIIRSGRDLVTVSIRFSEIGRIVTHRNALYVIRKGIGPNIGYYFGRYKEQYNCDIMYIPVRVEDFDRIKKYLKKVKRK